MRDMLEAIGSVQDAVIQSRVSEERITDSVVTTLRQLASTVREKAEIEWYDMMNRVRGHMLKPVDPLEIRWTPLSLLGIANKETRWTQWIAGILRKENGEALARIVWQSLCDSVILASREPRQVEEIPYALASLQEWRRAKGDPPKSGSMITDEFSVDGSRIDIVIDSPSILVVLENKLWSAWSDTKGQVPQVVRYRRIGQRLRERKPSGSLGLVLLSARMGLEAGKDYPFDYIYVSYWTLARALRSNLAVVLTEESSALSVMELWPAMLTVAEIERTIVEVDATYLYGNPNQTKWQQLNRLRVLAEYLDA